jgi:hypothetical protein
VGLGLALAAAMVIDRQRIAAIRLLEALGYAWRSGEWQSPTGTAKFSWVEPDGMHGALMHRADALAGCLVGSEEEKETRAD